MLSVLAAMTSRMDDPHRWGAYTMIAPQWRGTSASRWLARDEVAQRFVTVHRFEHDVDCSDVIERVRERAVVEGAATVIAVSAAHCGGARQPCPAVVSELVGAISVERAIEGRVWTDQRHAMAALRYATRALEHGVVHSSLAVDARARVIVAYPASAVPSLPQEPAIAAVELAAIARAMSANLPKDAAIEAVLDHCAKGAFRSVIALDEALANAGVPTPTGTSYELPVSLDAHALAAAQLAQRALEDSAFRSSAEAEALTPSLLQWLHRWPIDANVLVLLALLEPARQALRERSVRDRSIDKVVLALLGPLEPTWIPLHPTACARTAIIDNKRRTLCPMLWNELQPTASARGSEARFCVACARAVQSVPDETGEPQVLASDVCVFVKRDAR